MNMRRRRARAWNRGRRDAYRHDSQVGFVVGVIWICTMCPIGIAFGLLCFALAAKNYSTFKVADKNLRDRGDDDRQK